MKTVLFPDQLGAEDASSDLYRKIEAFNLWFTIQQNKVPASASARSSSIRSRCPDISFFEFWEYLPHNAVLWIWLKMGFLGFVVDALPVRQGDPARHPVGAVGPLARARRGRVGRARPTW